MEVSILYANVGIDYFLEDKEILSGSQEKCESNIQNIASKITNKRKMSYSCSFPKTESYTCSYLNDLYKTNTDIYVYGELCNYDYKYITFTNKRGYYYNMSNSTITNIFSEYYPYICRMNTDNYIKDLINVKSNIGSISEINLSKIVKSNIDTAKSSITAEKAGLCKMVSSMKVIRTNFTLYDPNKLKNLRNATYELFHLYFYNNIFKFQLINFNACISLSDDTLYSIIIDYQKLLLNIILDGLNKLISVITFKLNEENTYNIAIDKVLNTLFKNTEIFNKITTYIHEHFNNYSNTHQNIKFEDWYNDLKETVMSKKKFKTPLNEYISKILLHYIIFDENYLIQFYPYLLPKNRFKYSLIHISFIMKIPDVYINDIKDYIKKNVIYGNDLTELNKKLFLTGSNKYTIENVNDTLKIDSRELIPSTSTTNNYHITSIPNLNMYIINVHMRGKDTDLNDSYENIIKICNEIKNTNNSNNIIVVGDFNNMSQGDDRLTKLERQTIFSYKLASLGISEYFLGTQYSLVFAECSRDWLRQMNLHIYYYLPTHVIDSVELIKVNDKICSIITPISSHFPFIINIKQKSEIKINEFETLLLQAKSKIKEKVEENKKLIEEEKINKKTFEEKMESKTRENEKLTKEIEKNKKTFEEKIENKIKENERLIKEFKNKLDEKNTENEKLREENSMMAIQNRKTIEEKNKTIRSLTEKLNKFT